MSRWWIAIALIGCGETLQRPDAPEVADAADPDTPGPNVDAPPTPSPPRIVFQSAGGGDASSAGYRVRLSIGAPQPMGNASSAGYRVRLGPITE